MPETGLARRERELYEEVWTAAPYDAFSPGVTSWPVLQQLVGSERGHLLDCGCGNGEAGLLYAEAGFDVTLMDLSDAWLTPAARRLPFWPGCLWQGMPRRAVLGGKWDIVTCTDVLEHLPTQFTMLAIDHMLRVGRRVFLSIALQPDVMGAWVGKPLHQTVQSFVWWRDAIREIGTLLEGRDLVQRGVYWVQPR